MTQILRGSAAGVLRHTNTCLSCVPLARQTSTTPTSSACRAPCFHSSHHTTAHTPPDAKLRSGNGAVLRPVRSAFLVCHYANRPGLPPSSSRLNSCSPPRAQTYPPSPAPLPSPPWPLQLLLSCLVAACKNLVDNAVLPLPLLLFALPAPAPCIC